MIYNIVINNILLLLYIYLKEENIQKKDELNRVLKENGKRPLIINTVLIIYIYFYQDHFYE